MDKYCRLLAYKFSYWKYLTRFTCQNAIKRVNICINIKSTEKSKYLTNNSQGTKLFQQSSNHCKCIFFYYSGYTVKHKRLEVLPNIYMYSTVL